MCRKWRVISHPLNTNPFPGSFLNYRGRLRLREVTLNNLTLVELEGGFDTEHAVSSSTFPSCCCLSSCVSPQGAKVLPTELLDTCCEQICLRKHLQKVLHGQFQQRRTR